MGGRKTHGQSRTVEWKTWRRIHHRCYWENDPSFPNYGGRGIQVCSRWFNYDNFLSDMGRRPADKYSIDRVNNKLHYTPSNCRWATRAEQQQNKTTTKLTRDNARKIRTSTDTTRALAKQYGVSQTVVCDIKNGLTWKEDQMISELTKQEEP